MVAAAFFFASDGWNRWALMPRQDAPALIFRHRHKCDECDERDRKNERTGRNRHNSDMATTNTKSIADVYAVNVRTVERWAREGKVKAVRVGELGHWRIEVDEDGYAVEPDNEE